MITLFYLRSKEKDSKDKTEKEVKPKPVSLYKLVSYVTLHCCNWYCFVAIHIRPDLLDVLLLELAQLQNRPGWPVKKKKKVEKAVIF